MDNLTATRRRIHRSGRLSVALPPDEAIKLFTAEGERLWVPGWNPEILGSLPQRHGLVFITENGQEHTIWTVIESNLDKGHVRYSRVTPGSRAGIVSVDVTGADRGSMVTVTYDLTALSESGAQSLEAYSSLQFSAMMEEWQRLIERMLASSHPDLRSLTF